MNFFTGATKLDPWLDPFKGVIHRRYKKAQEWLEIIGKTEGGIEKFSRVSAPGSQAPPPPWSMLMTGLRAPRFTASTLTPPTISPTANGPRMLLRRPLWATSVSAPPPHPVLRR